jgi:hypothetical protein
MFKLNKELLQTKFFNHILYCGDVIFLKASAILIGLEALYNHNTK